MTHILSAGFPSTLMMLRILRQTVKSVGQDLHTGTMMLLLRPTPARLFAQDYKESTQILEKLLKQTSVQLLELDPLVIISSRISTQILTCQEIVNVL